MTTVSDAIAFLEKFAPPDLAETWDNVGLLVGRRDSHVEKIMTCLTLTPDVAAEAIEKDVQLVVSHHPVLFRGAKQITDATSEGRMLLDLIENGVAVYSPHTSFDSAELGINQQLAESFGLLEIVPLRPREEGNSGGGGAELGSGRVGRLEAATDVKAFLAMLRTVVAADYIEFSGNLENSVERVAVACGSAAEFLEDAIRLGCDTFVAGEVRFHSALQARGANVNLVLLGHYSSERPAVERLAEILSAEFSAATIFASAVETDPLAVYSG